MWHMWEADYHMNINLQMNYWPADLCNLSETLDPFVDWFTLTDRGKATATRLYGSDGWVAYTATNPFGRTTPSGSTTNSQFMNGVLDPLAGAWMAMTLWQHTILTRRKVPARLGLSDPQGSHNIFARHHARRQQRPLGRRRCHQRHRKTNTSIRRHTREFELLAVRTYHMTLVRVVLDATRQGAEILNVDRELNTRIATCWPSCPPGRQQTWCDPGVDRGLR